MDTVHWRFSPTDESNRVEERRVALKTLKAAHKPNLEICQI
jgi:hypothetical protein